MVSVAVAYPSEAVLGESPVWSPFRKQLLWVDTFGASLNSFDPITGKNTSCSMPAPLCFVAETPRGQLVVGIGCHIYLFKESGELKRVATVSGELKGYRLNDACMDSMGRLWVGLMDNELTEGSGYLYRLDPDGTVQAIDSGFTLINGMDWSPDRKTFYVTDSRQGLIYAYDHDPYSGAVSNRRLFVKIASSYGKPDGLTVDPNGTILSVLFDGSAIALISAEGEMKQLIELPVIRPTSCVFSDNTSSLYVTTARLGLSKMDLERMPDSGSLLKIDYGRVLSR